MGYITSAITTTLTAKLTPLGRTLLLQNDTNLISTFSLGDSDANYNTSQALVTGEVPSNGGLMGTYGSVTNSVATNTNINSFAYVNSSGLTKKSVEPQSSAVTINYILNGFTTVTAVTKNVISRNDNTNPLVNLYYSFNLPLNANDDYKFTGLTSNFGGYANTALSGLSSTNILVLGINNSSYGELIDGKSISIQLTTSATTYTLYSTYQNTGIPLSIQDVQYNDIAPNTKFLGNNISFLVSDNIKTPNGGNASLSWSTGYNTNKPFSQSNKQLYNFVSNTSIAQTADTVVGIAYLDKGFMVITNPTIVNLPITAVTISFNSVSTNVSQNITCIANRGEFGSSTNRTFTSGDDIRISEVGLYDSTNNLIAIAKTDRQIVKNINDFFALNIKLTV